MVCCYCGLGSYLHPNFPPEIVVLANVTVTLDFQRSEFYRGMGQWYYNGSPLHRSTQELNVSSEGKYTYILRDGFEVLEVHSTSLCKSFSSFVFINVIFLNHISF